MEPNDGAAELPGRTDGHVHVAGDRVALGDIGRVLQEHPHIREAAAAVQQVADEQKLVAYIVADGIGPTVSQLRAYLEQRVPAHMMPSAFVSLAELPRTSAGAVDHAALPPPQPLRPAAEQSYVAPRSPVEAAIASIWAEALLLDRVGIHDDFLDIGGDSLIATQIIARVWERFGTEIPIQALFEGGSIAVIVDQFFGDAVPRAEGA